MKMMMMKMNNKNKLKNRNRRLTKMMMIGTMIQMGSKLLKQRVDTFRNEYSIIIYFYQCI